MDAGQKDIEIEDAEVGSPSGGAESEYSMGSKGTDRLDETSQSARKVAPKTPRMPA